MYNDEHKSAYIIFVCCFLLFVVDEVEIVVSHFLTSRRMSHMTLEMGRFTMVENTIVRKGLKYPQRTVLYGLYGHV
jgi:hypothetical protein